MTPEINRTRDSPEPEGARPSGPAEPRPDKETRTASQQAAGTGNGGSGQNTPPRRHRYGLLLLILIVTYLLSAFYSSEWISVAQLALFTTTGLLALRNSPFKRHTVRLMVAGGLVGSAIMIVVTALLLPSTDLGRGLAAIWTGLLLLLTVTLIVRQILSLPVVTVQSIFGALSAYLIIGLMFSALYSAMYNLNKHQFFSAGQLHGHANPAIFQYFSFTTLTTLGYGDFTAASNGGRAVAVLEAVAGQIFLATLVARLVAAFRPPASPSDAASADADG